MDALAAREHAALIAAYSAVADASAKGWVRKYGGVVAAISGSELNFFNQLLVADEATAGDLVSALAPVTAAGLDYEATLRVGIDDHVEPPLTAAGMEHESWLIPGMALTPIQPTRPETDLDIRSGGDIVAAHNRVATLGFEVPDGLLADLLTTDLADFTFYTGYLDGEAVASSVGFVHDESVTVFNVTTLPGFRGRGYGAAMTIAAVEGGRVRGADVAFLQSSRMGLGVYQRLGFETVVEYREWASPKASPS